jgi:hypothetical protein
MTLLLCLAELVVLSAGIVLLSLQYGWETGVGIACLIWYMKGVRE